MFEFKVTGVEVNNNKVRVNGAIGSSSQTSESLHNFPSQLVSDPIYEEAALSFATITESIGMMYNLVKSSLKGKFLMHSDD